MIEQEVTITGADPISPDNNDDDEGGKGLE